MYYNRYFFNLLAFAREVFTASAGISSNIPLPIGGTPLSADSFYFHVKKSEEGDQASNDDECLDRMDALLENLQQNSAKLDGYTNVYYLTLGYNTESDIDD